MQKITVNGLGEVSVSELTDEEVAAVLNPISPQLVPPSISRRQAAKGMLLAGMITDAESLAMVQTAAVPGFLQGFINELTTRQQTLVLLDFAADDYFRNSETLDTLAYAAGTIGIPVSPADLDRYFREWSLL